MECGGGSSKGGKKNTTQSVAAGGDFFLAACYTLAAMFFPNKRMRAEDLFTCVGLVRSSYKMIYTAKNKIPLIIRLRILGIYITARSFRLFKEF